MTGTATSKVKRLGAWLWRQIVEPDPGEYEAPQDGPIELWTSLPTNTGEKPERKVAGVWSRAQAERIADHMGLIVYFILESDGEKMHARLDQQIREKKQAVAVNAA